MFFSCFYFFLSCLPNVNAYDNTELKNIDNLNNNIYLSYKPRMINTIRTRKENVKFRKEYGPYKRVSPILSKGAYIEVDRTLTFSISITGNIKNIGISPGFSISSGTKISYDNLKFDEAYIGCRCEYSVETGFEVMYDALTGKVYSKKPYTIKKPIKPHYELLKA